MLDTNRCIHVVRCGPLIIQVMNGNGFEYTHGAPFAWYHWADYKQSSPFNWLGLIGDIVFWLPIVLGVGLLTDKITKLH
jgi:hypothetical protein